jgi:hypothetical protein
MVHVPTPFLSAMRASLPQQATLARLYYGYDRCYQAALERWLSWSVLHSSKENRKEQGFRSLIRHRRRKWRGGKSTTRPIPRNHNGGQGYKKRYRTKIGL